MARKQVLTKKARSRKGTTIATIEGGLPEAVAEFIADQSIEITKAHLEESQEAPRPTPRDSLCVFAFRLTEEERDAIHKAAGPAKASKFARQILVAAANNDLAQVKMIMRVVANNPTPEEGAVA